MYIRNHFLSAVTQTRKNKLNILRKLRLITAKSSTTSRPMRFHYGDDTLFICGYEAGCLGFTLYHQLMDHGVKCVILAPDYDAATER
jgi:hypothetical protein